MRSGRVFVALLQTMNCMKFLVLWLGMCLPFMADAQKSNERKKTNFEKRSKLVLIKDMNQRRIYSWQDGQRSTASGRQALDPSAVYARVYKDSAVVVVTKKEDSAN